MNCRSRRWSRGEDPFHQPSDPTYGRDNLGLSRWTIGLAVCLSFAPILCAQEQPPSSVAGGTNIVDYGRGFAALLAIGVIDVAGAEYVSLRMDPPHEMSSHIEGLTDRAWLLKAKEDGKSVVVFLGDNGKVVVHNVDTMAAARRAGSESVAKGKTGGPVQGTGDDVPPLFARWVAADPRKDALVLLDRLADMSKGKTDRLNEYNFGEYVRVAAQYYSAGLRTESNAMFHQLRDFGADRELIESVVGPIADLEYARVADRFSETGDWPALVKSLESLMSKFGSSWPKSVEARFLLRQAKTRVGQGSPPPLKATGLTAEDQELAAAMVTGTPKANVLPEGFLWILPGVRKDQGVTSNVPASAMVKILQRGIKSVPMLMVLTNDNFLTTVDRSSLPYDDREYVDWYHIATTERRINNGIDGHFFLTREHLAAVLLHRLVLPDDPDRSYSYSYGWSGSGESGIHASPPTWQSVEDWFVENKGKSATELALTYLQRGTSEQSKSALSWLLANGSTSDSHRVEEHLRDRECSSVLSSLVEQYVNERGVKAKAFVEEYGVALSNRYARMPVPRRKGDLDPRSETMNAIQIVRSLKVRTVPVGEVLAEVVAGRLEPYYASEAIERESAAGRLSLALGSAAAATNPATRISLVETLYDRRSYPREVSPSSVRDRDVVKYADQWRVLLDDRRVATRYGVDVDMMTVGDAAAKVMDGYYGTACRRRCPSLVGGRMQGLMMERARARLDGVPEQRLPSLPCSENVSLARRMQLVKDVMDTSPTNVVALVTSLGMEESLALYEEMEWNRELLRKLIPVMCRVTRVDTAVADTNVCAVLNALNGKTLDREMVMTAVNTGLRTLAGNGKIMIVIERQACFDGTRIMAFEAFEEMDKWDWVMCRCERNGEDAFCAVLYSWWGEFDEVRWPAKDKGAEDKRLHALVDKLYVGPGPDECRCHGYLNGRIVVLTLPRTGKTGPLKQW